MVNDSKGNCEALRRTLGSCAPQGVNVCGAVSGQICTRNAGCEDVLHHTGMSDLTLKICVVGPSRTGKTLLCRALAEQPVMPGEYNPTAAVRCAVNRIGCSSAA